MHAVYAVIFGPLRSPSPVTFPVAGIKIEMTQIGDGQAPQGCCLGAVKPPNGSLAKALLLLDYQSSDKSISM